MHSSKVDDPCCDSYDNFKAIYDDFKLIRDSCNGSEDIYDSTCDSSNTLHKHHVHR